MTDYRPPRRTAEVRMSMIGCVFWIAVLMVIAALLAKWVLS